MFKKKKAQSTLGMTDRVLIEKLSSYDIFFQLTWATVNIVITATAKTEQTATTPSATYITGVLTWAPSPPTSDISSSRENSLLVSSARCANCFSAAILRFPAGEEFMHSPVSRKSDFKINNLQRIKAISPESLSHLQQLWSSGAASEVQQGTHWLFKRSKCSGNAQVTQEYCPGPLQERQESWQVLQVCVGLS